MAHGLPVEGDDGPFVGERVSPVTTCAVTGTVGEARALLDRAAGGVVAVLAGDGCVVGELDAGMIAGTGDEGPVFEVMAPVPATIRPSVTVESVAGAGGGRRLVTTPDGRLLGEVSIDARHDDDHDHDDHDHDHDDHEPDHDHVDMERYERELTEVLEALGERFGDRGPSDEELRAFLHDRLVAEGRSAADADRFLDELADGADRGNG
jgi:hypothetical protein